MVGQVANDLPLVKYIGDGRRGKSKLTIALKRSNAVNNVALKLLLQAKVGRGPSMHNPGVAMSLDPRYTGMLTYLRSTTSIEDDVHLDLSNSPIGTSDFVVLRSVLSAHPSISSINLSNTKLTPFAMRTLRDVVFENPHIMDVNLGANTSVPDPVLSSISQRLHFNRLRSARRMVSYDRRRERKKARHARAIFESAIRSLLEAQRSAYLEVCTSEGTERLALLASLNANIKRVLRMEARRVRRQRRALAIRELVIEETELREISLFIEEEEMCHLTEAQEEAERRVFVLLNDVALQFLKRRELTGWSAAKKAEKNRKQSEHEARDMVGKEAAIGRERIVNEEYRYLTFELSPCEKQGRAEAVEAQTFREDKEAREQWLKEREAKELQDREEWQAKQLIVEQDIKKAQHQKQRMVVSSDEEKARRTVDAEYDGLTVLIGNMLRADQTVAKNTTCYRALLVERSLLVAMPPSIAIDVTATKKVPGMCFVNDNQYTPVLKNPKLGLSFPRDTVDRLTEVDMKLRMAHKDLRDACEAANKECTKMHSKNESNLRKLLIQYFNVSMPKEVEAPHCAAICGAIISACSCMTVAPLKRLGKRLRDVVKATRTSTRSAFHVYSEPEMLVLEDPKELLEQKIKIAGGHLNVACEDKSHADVFSMSGNTVRDAFGRETPSLRVTRSFNRRKELEREHSMRRNVNLTTMNDAPPSPRMLARHLSSPRSFKRPSAVEDATCIDFELPRNGITPDAVLDIVKSVMYDYDTTEDTKLPCERKINFTLKLYFYGGTQHEVTLNFWASVIVVQPMITVSDIDSMIRYKEDTLPDVCKVFNVTVNDATQVTWAGIYAFSLGNYHNYVLNMTFTEGHTDDDVLMFSYSDAMYLRQGERKDINMALVEYGDVHMCPVPDDTQNDPEKLLIWYEDGLDKPVPIAEVVKGSLFSTSKPPTKAVLNNRQVTIRLFSKLVSTETVRKLLKRIRFGNFSQDPTPGNRTLELAMVDCNGNSSKCHVRIDIIAEDDPATMELATNKLTFRQICSTGLPPAFKKYISLPMIRPCWGVKVEDVDTDRFVGGYLECSLTAGVQRGDVLMMACPILNSEEEIGERTSICILQRKTEDGVENTVVYEGRHVATVVKGVVFDPSWDRGVFESMLNQLDADEMEELSLLFSSTGEASITCCSKLLASIAWSSLYLRPKEGDRVVEICLQPGSSFPKGRHSLVNTLLTTELDPPLEDKVMIKVAPEFFEVPQTTLQYREGSGQVRLAPFELTMDNIDYQYGYVMVEIIDGSTASDILGLKGSSEVKLVKREADDVPDEPQPRERRARSSTIVKNILRDKVSKALTPHIRANLILKDIFISQMQEAAAERIIASQKPKLPTTVYDTYLLNAHIGVLSQTSSWMCLSFGSKTLVKRKDVITILRSLTYSNTSLDPGKTVKHCKVTVNDGGQCSSEAIIQIEIQEVDDVTDIIVKSPKVTYRQGAHEVFPLAPMGQVWLQDPDTMWFTGGNITVELSSGHTKTDQVAFMTVNEQKLCRAKHSVNSEFPFAADEHPYLVLKGEDILIDGTDTVVGTMASTKCGNWSPSNNLKISFSKVPNVVSIQLASYCFNCISYTSLADKMQPASSRTYTLLVHDGANPEQGRNKITVEVLSPIMVLQNTDLKPPFAYVDEVVCRTPEVNVYILPKASISWICGKDEKGKPKDVVGGGTVSMTFVSGRQDQDVITLVKKDVSITKDQIYFGRDHLGKVSQTLDKYSIELASTTKIKTKTLAELIRTFTVRLAAGSSVPRVLKVVLVDSATLPTEGLVTITPKF